MRNYPLIIIVLFVAFGLQSCAPTPDGLFKKIESETGLKLTANSNGTDDVTKSMSAKVLNTKYNLEKVSKIPNSIDSYLKMLPTKKTSDFDVVMAERYEWENSEFKVRLKIIHFPDDLNVIIFYTTK